ncbi:MAG: hypothetical protein N2692_02315 [Patescibacteria group bacterium]|nr:hypothetical protein [Patescibacteria group bacterium]
MKNIANISKILFIIAGLTLILIVLTISKENLQSALKTRYFLACVNPYPLLHITNVYISPNPALVNQTVTIKTDAIPECNSSTASCEWRWSGDVSSINSNKLRGEWTTTFTRTGTKNIKVEVYIKDLTICGDDWIKVAYGEANLEVVSGGVTPTPTPTPTSTPTPTPTPTSTGSSGGGPGYWEWLTPTPTVLGTSTCQFTHFPTALIEKTCWINGKTGGLCMVSTSDGFNVRLSVISGSYYEDIRVNIAIFDWQKIINPNLKIGSYQFIGDKIIHIAVENEDCKSVELENLAVLQINYFDSKISGINENSLTIVQAKYLPTNWNLRNTIRYTNNNNLSIFTSDFGYFGIMGLPVKQVLGAITVAKPTPTFISWYDSICGDAQKDLTKFFALAALWDKIRHFNFSWYFLSLLFNLLLLLWLFWVYIGKKLLEKYRTTAQTEGMANTNIPANNQSNPTIINLPPATINYQDISTNKDNSIITDASKEIKEDDEQILKQLKEKLSTEF